MTKNKPASNGKVVLITGAARRIGAAVARHLHAEGARISVHYHSSEAQAQQLKQELEANRPDSVQLVQTHLGTQQGAGALIDEVLEHWGQLDVLINNASSFYPTPLETITEADIEKLFGSNFLGPLFLSQAALVHLQKQQGCIVNMIDVHAKGVLSGHVVYASAKAALQMQTRILARDLAPAVRVNGVAPGSILWPEGDAAIDAEKQQAILKGIPMGRNGSPEDIARTISFLCSDEAAYITGQIIAVDGGRSLS
ncbi:MAG: pteridine reductase [Granulosicoccus sp.]